MRFWACGGAIDALLRATQNCWWKILATRLRLDITKPLKRFHPDIYLRFGVRGVKKGDAHGAIMARRRRGANICPVLMISSSVLPIGTCQIRQPTTRKHLISDHDKREIRENRHQFVMAGMSLLAAQIADEAITMLHRGSITVVVSQWSNKLKSD